MDNTQDKMIYCHACKRSVKLAENANVGDMVTCPFCGQKHELAEMTVLIGKPLEEA